MGTGFEEADRNKAEAMQQWKMMTRVMDAELTNAIYLPGIDTLTLALDGRDITTVEQHDSNPVIDGLRQHEFNEAEKSATLLTTPTGQQRLAPFLLKT